MWTMNLAALVYLCQQVCQQDLPTPDSLDIGWLANFLVVTGYAVTSRVVDYIGSHV